MKVVPSIYMPEFKFVKRTWKERLFTRPWNPFRRYNKVIDDTAYVMDDVILVNYHTWSKFLEYGMVKSEQKEDS